MNDEGFLPNETDAQVIDRYRRALIRIRDMAPQTWDVYHRIAKEALNPSNERR